MPKKEVKTIDKFYTKVQHLCFMAKKLLNVKECKEIYGLSRDILINYEKKGLITPIIYRQRGSKKK